MGERAYAYTPNQTTKIHQPLMHTPSTISKHSQTHCITNANCLLLCMYMYIYGTMGDGHILHCEQNLLYTYYQSLHAQAACGRQTTVSLRSKKRSCCLGYLACPVSASFFPYSTPREKQKTHRLPPQDSNNTLRQVLLGSV